MAQGAHSIRAQNRTGTALSAAAAFVAGKGGDGSTQQVILLILFVLVALLLFVVLTSLSLSTLLPLRNDLQKIISN
jgi:ABC-type polysaccharide/polyol phosphate export permease